MDRKIKVHMLTKQERINAEEALQQQLLLARAINQIAKSISIQDNPDFILEDTVRIIGTALAVDRALIYDISFDKQQAIGLCEYLNPQYPDITPTKATYPLNLFIGGATEMLRTQQWLASQSDEITPHFLEDGSGEILHNQMMIQSLLWYPFSFRENSYYLLTLNQIHSRREWTGEELDFLDAVSQQVSIALAKKSYLIKERQQTDSLRKLTQVVEQSPNSIIISDLEGNIEYVNPACVATTGYSLAEIVGKSPLLFQSDKTSPATRDAIMDHLSRGASWRGELVNRRKDGTEYTVSAHIAPMRQSDGRITHNLSIQEDITNRKQAEERIQFLANSLR